MNRGHTGDTAKQAYDAGKAPPQYYEEKWDGEHHRWLRLTTIGLYYCWLADGMPTTQQRAQNK